MPSPLPAQGLGPKLGHPCFLPLQPARLDLIPIESVSAGSAGTPGVPGSPGSPGTPGARFFLIFARNPLYFGLPTSLILTHSHHQSPAQEVLAWVLLGPQEHPALPALQAKMATTALKGRWEHRESLVPLDFQVAPAQTNAH